MPKARGRDHWNWKGGPVELTCDQCGEPFLKERRFYNYGLKKGQQHWFCGKTCYGLWQRENRLGEEHYNWQGGRHERTDGYINVYDPTKPQHRVFEHRRVAARALGRPLRRTEIVHHINLDKSDNRPSNLLICSQAYHRWLTDQMARCWVREHIGG